jgi:hypothetical protein
MPSMLGFEIGRSNVQGFDFQSRKLITLYVIYYVMLLCVAPHANFNALHWRVLIQYDLCTQYWGGYHDNWFRLVIMHEP